MCQYSCPTGTGLATPWHLVHQGAFSIRGASLVFTEASAVLANGGITSEDMGIWNDEQAAALKPIVDFHHGQGAKAGIQLAHAGRKASTYAPWLTDGLVSPPPVHLNGSRTAPPEVGGWDDVWAPSAIPFSEGYPMPQEMTEADIQTTIDAFVAATKRADQVGYDVVERACAPPCLQDDC
jgi:2,4-dienoyl-CoA reductase-like NADH-dependent reductase (Old Yellow Enzyme family)